MFCADAWEAAIASNPDGAEVASATTETVK
jgi:hypothetical protein